MKLLTTATTTTLFATLATASSLFDDFHPPSLNTDSRGPCPGLNALANHGILPRSGKNITLPDIITGLGALNISAEVATGFGAPAFRTSSNPAGTTFDLSDLNKHGLIEHDGSLTRRDADKGAQASPKLDQELYEEFMGYFNGSQRVTLPAAAAARWSRIQASRATNPNFAYTAINRFTSYSETLVYYMVLQDPATQSVPVDFLKVFFEEERFPAAEGWKPLTSLNAATLGSNMLGLAISTPEDPSDLVVPAAAA